MGDVIAIDALDGGQVGFGRGAQGGRRGERLHGERVYTDIDQMVRRDFAEQGFLPPA